MFEKYVFTHISKPVNFHPSIYNVDTMSFVVHAIVTTGVYISHPLLANIQTIDRLMSLEW